MPVFQKRNSWIILCFGVIFCVLPTGILAGPIDFQTMGTQAVTSNPQKKAGKALVIGRVSNNPKKHYPRLKGLVDYVVKNLDDPKISMGKVIMAKDNLQMIGLLKTGKVDWITETPISAMLFAEKAQAEIALRRWKRGVPTYYSIFIARKDSGIERLEDLVGKKIGFNDPGSTTSFFIPSAILLRKGIHLVELPHIRAEPEKGKVSYAFSGGDELNLTAWVYQGVAHAVAMSNLDWQSEEDVPKELKKHLKIFYKSKPIPRALELFRKDFDPTLKNKIKKILMTAHQDPAANAALKAYEETTRFDKINPEIQKSLEETGKLLQLVKKKLD